MIQELVGLTEEDGMYYQLFSAVEDQLNDSITDRDTFFTALPQQLLNNRATIQKPTASLPNGPD